MGNAYKILIRKPERKRLLGRPSCTWDGNIQMNLKEIGCDNVDWIHLA
jgi:hypothetical protein